MHPDPFKESRVHAYIDNELIGSDRTELLEEMHSNAKLRDQVCELRRIKDLVQQAYFIPPPPNFQTSPKKNTQLYTLLSRCAVIVLVLLSFAGGWLVHAHEDRSLMGHLASLGAVELPAAAHTTAATSPRVLLHIASDNPEIFASTLKQANYLLNKGKKDGIEVEVVANAGGLKLLEANDNSHYSKVVSTMIKAHPNLHFVACGITVHKLEAAGVPVELIHHVRVAPSAVEEIVKRLREGWMYVNV